MDFDEYRKRGKEMVDYIADYLENIRDRKVFPDVKPGYMRNLLPDSAPVEGEQWETIFGDIERVIMPGVTHWQSPHMHAYFPALNSFPSLLGDMLADAINCLGFTWASSPACTELETIVMNWLGKMIGLPDEFLHLNSASNGGGVIQTTASEATLVCLLAGRTRAIKRFHEKTPGYQDAQINARLVAYCSDQAHSSVEKAALIGLVRMRYIESDENLSMRGSLLREAIEDDIKQGLIPFWVCATLGTTGACAFDNVEEVGVVCREFNLWLHLDAAYAGSAFICPEYRIWLKGVERADSIAFNPSKWLMVHFDCTAMWVKDSTAVHRTFNVEPLYLQHENSGLAIDYMHWQIPLSKRFRALKMWFVLRSFGIKGLQKHIREGVRLAQKIEALISSDHRFEVPAARHLGMVVFRVKGDNELTEKLLKRLNHRGNIHCVPASLKGKYVIRFTVTSTRTTTDDILNDWSEIRLVATQLLEELNIQIAERTKVLLKDTKEKNEAFGSSLLLSNSPMSPKIVNGSFAAIFDADEFLAKTYAGIRIAHQDSPSMRRRVRGILMSGKQFSLDSHMDIVVQSCVDSSEEAYGKSNPICEDNEDQWEAYESPGTPPATPSPQVSPMIQTPTPTTAPNPYSAQPQTAIETQQSVIESVRTHNKSPPNSLSVPRNFFNNNYFGHKPIVGKADHEISDSQPKCTFNHDHANQRHKPQNRNEPSKDTANTENNGAQRPNASNADFGGKTQSKRKNNIYVYSCNGKQNSISIKGGIKGKKDPPPQAVYHGKRFLDPIGSEDNECSFYNNGFCGTTDPRKVLRKGPANTTELVGREKVDWDAVMCNFSVHNPKFHVRVKDEAGQRIRTSFDSTPNGENSSRMMTPPSLWSSLECELFEGNQIGSDGWGGGGGGATRDTSCLKCGHTTPGDGSSSGSGSSPSAAFYPIRLGTNL